MRPGAIVGALPRPGVFQSKLLGSAIPFGTVPELAGELSREGRGIGPGKTRQISHDERLRQIQQSCPGRGSSVKLSPSLQGRLGW